MEKPPQTQPSQLEETRYGLRGDSFTFGEGDERRVVRFDHATFAVLSEAQRQANYGGYGEITSARLVYETLLHPWCQDDDIVQLARRSGVLEAAKKIADNERRPFPSYLRRPVSLPYHENVWKVFEGLAGQPDTAQPIAPGELVEAILTYEPKANNTL